MDADVIVVGAGPAGLMLAGELRLGGAEVIVLERRTEPDTASRASTLHSRTMELFEQRGLLERLGDPPNDPRGHFGGIPLALDGLPTRFPGQWKVLQTRTEELLARWAADLGADIRRGHEVTDVAVSGAHVTAGGLRAAYLVGCDGQDSTVRRSAGFRLTGPAATREMLLADLTGIEIQARRFQRLPGGLAIAGRRPDGVTRVMVHEHGRPAAHRTGRPEFAEVVKAWSAVTGEDLSSADPLWTSVLADAAQQAAEYRRGRVLLAGDAAHRQLPVGGQAINLGLQDAVNLGWKLAAQVCGRAPATLLDTYDSERRTVGARVLSSIRAQAMLLLGGPEVDPVREVFGELLGIQAVRDHLAGGITGLDVRYEPGDDPPAGTRLPFPEAAFLRDGRGVLIERRGDGTAGRVARGWADRVRVVAARPDADLPDHDALLVRPDGYVAWAGTDPEPALRQWFGAPAASA